MNNFKEMSDDSLFRGSEQPGSQNAYYRDTEIRRRLYVLQNEALKAQVAATQTQRQAISEMQSQSRIMLWSVIGIFASAVVTLLAAFVG